MDTIEQSATPAQKPKRNRPAKQEIVLHGGLSLAERLASLPSKTSGSTPLGVSKENEKIVASAYRAGVDGRALYEDLLAHGEFVREISEKSFLAMLSQHYPRYKRANKSNKTEIV